MPFTPKEPTSSMMTDSPYSKEKKPRSAGTSSNMEVDSLMPHHAPTEKNTPVSQSSSMMTDSPYSMRKSPRSAGTSSDMEVDPLVLHNSPMAQDTPKTQSSSVMTDSAHSARETSRPWGPEPDKNELTPNAIDTPTLIAAFERMSLNKPKKTVPDSSKARRNDGLDVPLLPQTTAELKGMKQSLQNFRDRIKKKYDNLSVLTNESASVPMEMTPQKGKSSPMHVDAPAHTNNGLDVPMLPATMQELREAEKPLPSFQERNLKGTTHIERLHETINPVSPGR